ncbi:MAG: TolB family protein, partial [Bryobacteraceae bacterium]
AGRPLLADNSTVVYVPPAQKGGSGHLLFLRENTVMAQPFDATSLQLAGDVFPVAERVGYGAVIAHLPVSVSANGVLVYSQGRGANSGNEIVWRDRSGKPGGALIQAMVSQGVAISPDEKSVAYPRFKPDQNSDLWLLDVGRGAESRFTFHNSSINSSPVWSPDGRRVAFSSTRAGSRDLYWKDTTGAGQDEPLLQGPTLKIPSDFSRDGKTLVYMELNVKTRFDLMLLPLEGDRKPAAFLQTEFNESHAQLSPDGRWIAYASDESTRNEVYVRPFPAGTGKWKVSLQGGVAPRWSRDGRELYFVAPDMKLMAAAVKCSTGRFDASTPVELFDPRFPRQMAG